MIQKIKQSRIISPFFISSVALALVGYALTFIAQRNAAFAEAVTQSVSAFVRFILAKATGWLPFSLAEVLLIAVLPLGICALIVYTVIKAKKSKGRRIATVLRSLLHLIGAAGIVYFLFAATFLVCYGRPSLEKNIGFERHLVDAQMLKSTAEQLADELNALIDANPQLISGEEGTRMPYSLGQMNAHLRTAYSSLCEKYSAYGKISAPVKPVILSEPMTYTHISGVYSFFTGEANLNTNFPDYTLPFTAAHEMAHQRGIAREDEANFSAFLACMESTDPYVRYSAYAMTLQYVTNALYSADRAAFEEVMYSRLNRCVINEMVAYQRFFDKYRESKAAEVSGAVNDSYLKAQGQEAGEKSYGMVVDLVVVYYENKIN